jgi:hypothetical protein
MGQTALHLIAHSAVPTLGTVPVNDANGNPNWLKPGDALSASSERFYLSADPSLRIKEAKWLLVWNPNCGNVYNAVRLVKADNGPQNEASIASISAVNKSSPITGEVDVTAALNAILDELQSGSVPQPYKQIIMETRGSTVSKIYKSVIYIVWDVTPVL